MGRIIGERKSVEKTFTKEEIEIITNNLNSKIVELSEKVDNLTIENIKLKDENDQLVETNSNLNSKIVELSEKNNKDKTAKETDKNKAE